MFIYLVTGSLNLQLFRIASEMKMVSVKSLRFICILTFSLTESFVHAQDADQSSAGFISIDCGLPSGSDRYIDNYTGIINTSDDGFVASGENRNVSDPEKALTKQYSTVRSFPNGTRNCYTIKVSQGKQHKYLIRASFGYGNYDYHNQPPTFNLLLGGDIWDQVKLNDADTPIRKEIIHILPSDYVHICLVNTDQGTPFISRIELRPLNSTNSMYTPSSGSLLLSQRSHFISGNNNPVRYKDDIYDRIWYLDTYVDNHTTVNSKVDIPDVNDYRVPQVILRNAITPVDPDVSLGLSWESSEHYQFYIYLHFAEVQELEAGQSREFNIYINNERWDDKFNVLKTSRVSTRYTPSPISGSKSYTIHIIKTTSSTLLPILNAWELHLAINFSSLTTEETDVTAIRKIKSTYGLLTKDWQGDPCFPQNLVWDGLNCSYDDPKLARIISLDLSKSGLNGEIARDIAYLTMLKTLDLSTNNLTGEVPDFLSQLGSLKFLNLKGNNFTGTVPVQLLDKWQDGSLELSFDDRANNTNTDCQSPPCKKKNNTSIVPVVGAVVGAVVGVLLAAIFLFYVVKRCTRRKQSGQLERRKQRFTYSEVQSITNKFEKLLGEGSFGKVYYGRFSNTEVAVKMLSQSPDQGFEAFQSEVTLLMDISHKNVTSLFGYCNEGSRMGIIYEYMANGSLDKHIFPERSNNALGWETRLRIAVEAARGLAYLHHGCKTTIIHRDVKPGNILLDEKLQVKLADFGLSKAYSVEGDTHASTIHVAGTPGYLDPEVSNRLTVKSDVYSFGIVVLVMITGKTPEWRNQEHTLIRITDWVDSYVQNGDIREIVDPRFRGDYKVNSVEKAVGLAMTCASKHPSERPTMKSVVIELNECLDIQKSRD